MKYTLNQSLTHTKPITHNHSCRLTQIVHAKSVNHSHSLNQPHSDSSRSLYASRGRQMPPSTRPRAGGKSRHHPSSVETSSSSLRFSSSVASHAPPLVGAYCPAMLPSSGLALACPEWVEVQRSYVVSSGCHVARFASCRLALARLSSRSAGLVVQPRSCLRTSLPLAQPCRPAAHKATRLPYRARAISRANAPQATHPLADGLATRQRTRQPDSARSNPTTHALAPLGCLRYAVAICSLRSQGAIAPLRLPSQASAINPAAHKGSQTP